MFVTSFKNEIVQKLWIYWITVFFRKHKKPFFYSFSTLLLWNFIELLLKIIIKLFYFYFFYHDFQIIVASIGLTLLSLYIFYLFLRIWELIIFFLFFVIFFSYCFLHKIVYVLFLIKDPILYSIKIFLSFSNSLLLLPSYSVKYLSKYLISCYLSISDFILAIFLILLKPLGMLPLLPLVLDLSNEYQKIIRIIYYTIANKLIRLILFFKSKLDSLKLKSRINKKVKRLIIQFFNNLLFLRIIIPTRKEFEPTYWPIPLFSSIFKNKNWYKILFLITKRREERRVFSFNSFLINQNVFGFNRYSFINSQNVFIKIKNNLLSNQEFLNNQLKNINISIQNRNNYHSLKDAYYYRNTNYLIYNIRWFSFIYDNNININFFKQKNKKKILFNWLFKGLYKSIFENNKSSIVIGSPEISGYPFLTTIIEATKIPLIYLSCKDLLYICNKSNETNLFNTSNYIFESKFALSIDMVKELSPCIFFLNDVDFFDEASYLLSKNRAPRESILENFKFDMNNQDQIFLSKSQETKQTKFAFQAPDSNNIICCKDLNLKNRNNKLESLKFKISQFKSHYKSSIQNETYSYKLILNWIKELHYEKSNKNIFLLIYSKLPKKLDPTLFFHIKKVFYIRNLDPSMYCNSFKVLPYRENNIFKNSSSNLNTKNQLFKIIIDLINHSKFQNFWWTSNNLFLKSILKFQHLFYKKLDILNNSLSYLIRTEKSSKKSLKNLYRTLNFSFFVRWEEIYYILGRITLDYNLVAYSPTFILFMNNIDYESINYSLSTLYIESSSSEPLILEFSIIAQVIKSLSGLVARDLCFLRLKQRNTLILNSGSYRINEDLSLVYHLFQGIIFECFNTGTFLDKNKENKKIISSSTKTRSLIYMFEKNDQKWMRDWLFKYPIKTKSNYIRRTAPFSLSYRSTIWTTIRRSIEGMKTDIAYFHPYSNYKHRQFSLLPISSFVYSEASKESEARKCISERLYLANNSTDYFGVPPLKQKKVTSLSSKRKCLENEFQTLVSIKTDNEKLTKFIFNEDFLSLHTIWNKYEDGINWLLNSNKNALDNYFQIALWRDLEYMLKLYVIYMIRRMEKIDFFFPVHLSMMGPLRFYAGYTYMDPKKILRFKNDQDMSKIIQESDPIPPFSWEKPSEELWFGLNEKIIRVLSLTLHPYFQRPLLYLSMMRIWGHVVSPPSSLSKAISSHSVLHLIPSYIHDEKFYLNGINKIEPLLYSLVFDSYDYLFYSFLNEIKVLDKIIKEIYKSHYISKEQLEDIISKIIIFS
jgi:hypothetical protein